VQGFSARPLTLFGLAGVVVVGALAPVVVVSLAGGSGSAGWLALAGGAACVSGLLLGTTQRVMPAVALALLAAGALTIAAVADDDQGGLQRFAFPARHASDQQERSRADNRADAEPRVAEGGEPATADEAGASAADASEPPAGTAARAGRPTRAQFVRGYYAAIERGDYEEAWSRLSASTQGQSFEVWRAGYATTVSQRVSDVTREPEGVVRYVLVAVDRTPCGTTTERRFEVRWRLVRSDRSYTATSLGATTLSGIDPLAAC
jgi:hypothetical protein